MKIASISELFRMINELEEGSMIEITFGEEETDRARRKQRPESGEDQDGKGENTVLWKGSDGSGKGCGASVKENGTA